MFLFFVQVQDDWQNKAKGVKKSVVKRLQPEEYESCLLDRQRVIFKEQHVFRSRLHNVFTENLRKAALNGADNKRYICADNINTLAWGHYDIARQMTEQISDDDIEMLEMEFLEMSSQ